MSLQVTGPRRPQRHPSAHTPEEGGMASFPWPSPPVSTQYPLYPVHPTDTLSPSWQHSPHRPGETSVSLWDSMSPARVLAGTKSQYELSQAFRCLRHRGLSCSLRLCPCQRILPSPENSSTLSRNLARAVMCPEGNRQAALGACWTGASPPVYATILLGSIAAYTRPSTASIGAEKKAANPCTQVGQAQGPDPGQSLQ